MLLIVDVKLCSRHLVERDLLIGPVDIALDSKEGVGGILGVPCVGAVDGFSVIEGHNVDIVQNHIVSRSGVGERKTPSRIFRHGFLSLPSLRNSTVFI